MTYDNLIYEVEQGICKITLNRPKVLNALNLALLSELKAAAEMAVQDPDVSVIVLTGAGRAFSAGVDISGPPDAFGAEKKMRAAAAHGLINSIQAAPKVVIAMVNGHCLTGALELALSCDLIVASSDAKFGDTHARWGLRPGWGMSFRLPLAVGLLKARELSFTADIVNAEEAHRMGLVNAVVAADRLEDTVKQIARKIMANSAESIAAYKHLYNQGQRETATKGLELEASIASPAKDTSQRLRGFSQK